MLQEKSPRRFSIEDIRLDFPVLSRRVHGKKLVYLDNAATTQKPKQVIDRISDYYENHNSNIHRSVHQLADEATEAFEATRDDVKTFVNAKSREEIVFTKNATEALNLAANSICERFLKPGDSIVVTEMEHHSNFVPWQQLAKKYGAKLEIASIDEEGRVNEEELETKLNGARVFAFTCMSNVLGTITDAKRLSALGHKHNCIVVADGAQSAPHMPTDVQDIGCDFFALSAHKMLGPTGVGCLFGKRDLLEEIPPFLLGGDMIKQVHREETQWNELPWKFEAGTSNIADVIGFSAAIEYLTNLGMQRIFEHEVDLSRIALEELQKIDSLEVYGPKDATKRGAVISFNLGKIHPHDVASILDSEGVAIRSGHHCAQVLMEKMCVTATSRASFYVYNGEDDIQALCDGLKKVTEVLS
ncbi:MAG: cysteine desulfurase [Nitrososphaerota archaeon]|nr:cysteine desulfurase [Nitrososphaerota archaeon]